MQRFNPHIEHIVRGTHRLPMASMIGDNNGRFCIYADSQAQSAAYEARIKRLEEALRAVLIMSRSPKPTKLDEALSWRENDELAHGLAREVLGKLPWEDGQAALQPDAGGGK